MNQFKAAGMLGNKEAAMAVNEAGPPKHKTGTAEPPKDAPVITLVVDTPTKPTHRGKGKTAAAPGDKEAEVAMRLVQ